MVGKPTGQTVMGDDLERIVNRLADVADQRDQAKLVKALVKSQAMKDALAPAKPSKIELLTDIEGKQLLTAHHREIHAALLAKSSIRAQKYWDLMARVPMTPAQQLVDKAKRVKELDNRLANAMNHRLMTLPKAIRLSKRISKTEVKPLNRRV